MKKIVKETVCHCPPNWYDYDCKECLYRINCACESKDNYTKRKKK